MKYWDARRTKRVRERERRRQERSSALHKAALEQERSYTKGALEKNANLMLQALGDPLRRKLLARLRREGAISLSKLGQPFNLKLPRLHKHMLVLERCGLITTHKHGRVRMCVYSRAGFTELASWLARCDK